MITGSILDIRIYVFDRYLLDLARELPGREHLARDLERAGFRRARVDRALDWLNELAVGHERAPLAGAARADTAPASVRVFTDGERARLSIECRGLLLRLEQAHVLSASQREIVIERMLALEADEPDTEQLHWVVLLVLSSQPGQERAVERFGALVADGNGSAPH